MGKPKNIEKFDEAYDRGLELARRHKEELRMLIMEYSLDENNEREAVRLGYYDENMG